MKDITEPVPIHFIFYNAAFNQNVLQIKTIIDDLDPQTKFDKIDVEMLNADLDKIADETKRSEIKAYFSKNLKEKFNYQELAESEDISSIESLEDVKEDSIKDELRQFLNQTEINSSDLKRILEKLKNNVNEQKNFLKSIVENKIKMADEGPGISFGNIYCLLKVSNDLELQTLLIQYMLTNHRNFNFYQAVGSPSILELVDNRVKKSNKDGIAKFISYIINNDPDFSLYNVKILLQHIPDKELIAKIFSQLHLRQFKSLRLTDFNVRLKFFPGALLEKYSDEINDVRSFWNKPIERKHKSLWDLLEKTPNNPRSIILSFLEDQDLNKLGDGATNNSQFKSQCLNMLLKGHLNSGQYDNVFYLLDSNCDHGFTIEWFQTKSDIPSDEQKKENMIYCYSQNDCLFFELKHHNEILRDFFSAQELSDIPNASAPKIWGQNIVEAEFHRILDTLYDRKIIPVKHRTKAAMKFDIDADILSDSRLIDSLLSYQNLELKYNDVFTIADLLLSIGAKLPEPPQLEDTLDLKALYLAVNIKEQAAKDKFLKQKFIDSNNILHCFIRYADWNGSHKTWGLYALLKNYIISHDLLLDANSAGDTPLHLVAQRLKNYYAEGTNKDKYFYLYERLFIVLFSKAQESDNFELILQQKNNAGESVLDIIRHTPLFFSQEIDIPDRYCENEFKHIKKTVENFSKICQDYLDHLDSTSGAMAYSKRKIVENLNNILVHTLHRVSTMEETAYRRKLAILKPVLREFINALQAEDKITLTKCRDTSWTKFVKYIMAVFMSVAYGWTGSKNRLFGPERTTGYIFINEIENASKNILQ